MIDNPHAVPAPTAADLERWYTGHGRMVVVIQEAGVFRERPMTPAELAAREPAYRIAMTIHHLASFAALSYIRVWEVISAAMEIGDYAHDARVTELLTANNREVERRRVAEAEAARMRESMAIATRQMELAVNEQDRLLGLARNAATRCRELTTALQEARDAWADQLAGDMKSCCTTLPDGTPNRDDMDEPSRPMIEETEALIARLDAALAGGQ